MNAREFEFEFKFDTVAFKLGVMIDDGYFIFSTLAFFSFGSRSQSLICLKVAVNVSSSGKPVLRYMYYVNEPGLCVDCYGAELDLKLDLFLCQDLQDLQSQAKKEK